MGQRNALTEENDDCRIGFKTGLWKDANYNEVNEYVQAEPFP